ncbi:hypothetical protein JMJ35_001410 [Cladonia borealis]|uniref:Uncharacterized protein n=1 Tax=Cladonia borealis TaxID=184061 RepID=A0AA39V5E6_9LECA|nr:hypothetical protein JMJ35_001410 [Cladonia borealis]
MSIEKRIYGLAGMTMLPPLRMPMSLLPPRRFFTKNAGSRPYAPIGSSVKSRTKDGSPGFNAIGSYKTIARRWTGILVGIPVIFVTSYVLYGRIILGKPQSQVLPADATVQATKDG